MMGGPASGKTTLVKSILGDRFDSFVNVNPDDMKEALPEYQVGLDASVKDTATVLHRESSHVANRVYNEGLSQGLNIIVDGTGRDKEKHIGRVQQLQREGYHVTLLMPDIDTDTAWARAKDRAERTGRYVPEKVLKTTHQGIPDNFETIARASDSFGLFDSRGGTPQMKWSGNKGEKDRMHDPKFVAKFQSRGQRLKAKPIRMEADMKKAGEKSSPAITIDEIADIVHRAKPKVSMPDKFLPKKYDRHVGIEWPVGDIDYVRKPKK